MHINLSMKWDYIVCVGGCTDNVHGKSNAFKCFPSMDSQFNIKLIFKDSLFSVARSIKLFINKRYRCAT